jgi:hypothetical protein
MILEHYCSSGKNKPTLHPTTMGKIDYSYQVLIFLELEHHNLPNTYVSSKFARKDGVELLKGGAGGVELVFVEWSAPKRGLNTIASYN